MASPCAIADAELNAPIKFINKNKDKWSQVKLTRNVTVAGNVEKRSVMTLFINDSADVELIIAAIMDFIRNTNNTVTVRRGARIEERVNIRRLKLYNGS